ncbi:STAS-like domain-containing protein [bacterium]|nr:STAS-like domain-containing protein [bacterium]
MENIIKLKENGSALGLRELAKQIGVNIKNAINENKNIILDFDKVNSISSSFADELIAKIMLECGQEKFVNLVKIRNTNDFVKAMITNSIIQRLESQEQNKQN